MHIIQCEDKRNITIKSQTQAERVEEMKKIQKEVDRLNDQIKKYKEFGTNSRNRAEHLQELVGWKNFLENATGISGTKRFKKYMDSEVRYRCLYVIETKTKKK